MPVLVKALSPRPGPVLEAHKAQLSLVGPVQRISSQSVMAVQPERGREREREGVWCQCEGGRECGVSV